MLSPQSCRHANPIFVQPLQNIAQSSNLNPPHIPDAKPNPTLSPNRTLTRTLILTLTLTPDCNAVEVDASNLLSDDHIDWARLSGLLQACPPICTCSLLAYAALLAITPRPLHLSKELRRHVVFLIDCASSEPLALQLIGRFVACVHTAHVAAQVSQADIIT